MAEAKGRSRNRVFGKVELGFHETDVAGTSTRWWGPDGSGAHNVGESRTRGLVLDNPILAATCSWTAARARHLDVVIVRPRPRRRLRNADEPSPTRSPRRRAVVLASNERPSANRRAEVLQRFTQIRSTVVDPPAWPTRPSLPCSGSPRRQSRRRFEDDAGATVVKPFTSAFRADSSRARRARSSRARARRPPARAASLSRGRDRPGVPGRVTTEGQDGHHVRGPEGAHRWCPAVSRRSVLCGEAADDSTEARPPNGSCERPNRRVTASGPRRKSSRPTTPAARCRPSRISGGRSAPPSPNSSYRRGRRLNDGPRYLAQMLRLTGDNPPPPLGRVSSDPTARSTETRGASPPAYSSRLAQRMARSTGRDLHARRAPAPRGGWAESKLRATARSETASCSTSPREAGSDVPRPLQAASRTRCRSCDSSILIDFRDVRPWRGGIEPHLSRIRRSATPFELRRTVSARRCSGDAAILPIDGTIDVSERAW